MQRKLLRNIERHSTVTNRDDRGSQGEANLRWQTRAPPLILIWWDASRTRDSAATGGWKLPSSSLRKSVTRSRASIFALLEPLEPLDDVPELRLSTGSEATRT